MSNLLPSAAKQTITYNLSIEDIKQHYATMHNVPLNKVQVRGKYKTEGDQRDSWQVFTGFEVTIELADQPTRHVPSAPDNYRVNEWGENFR